MIKPTLTVVVWYLVGYVDGEIDEDTRIGRLPVLDDILFGYREIVARPGEVTEEIRDLIVCVKRTSHELSRTQWKGCRCHQ